MQYKRGLFGAGCNKITHFSDTSIVCIKLVYNRHFSELLSNSPPPHLLLLSYHTTILHGEHQIKTEFQKITIRLDR